MIAFESIPSITRAPHKAGAAIRSFRATAFFAEVAAFLLIFCVTAIAGQAGATLPAGRELTDEIGRHVQVPQKVNRVVSLAPNLTEIVFALGNENHLAGDTDFCDYPAEAVQKPHV